MSAGVRPENKRKHTENPSGVIRGPNEGEVREVREVRKVRKR